MAKTHKDGDAGEETIVEPLILHSVIVHKTTKNVEVPRYIPIDVDLPVFHEKSTTEFIRQEKPTTEFVRTEKPTTEFIRQEKLTTEFIASKEKTVQYEVEVKPTTKYIVDEQPTTMYVKNEVAYDIPVIVMDKINAMADKAVSTLQQAETMLESVNSVMWSFKQAAEGLSKTIDELKTKADGLKNHVIEEVPIRVEVPVYEKQKVKILGKVVSIGEM